MADYLAHVERYPVLPHVKPGELIDALPRCGPDQGEPMSTILEDFRRQIVPAATLNMNGMLWKTSPAVVELEQVTLEWLRRWMGLPDPLFGIIFDTASTSSMHAIAAAREMVAPEVRTDGGGSGLILYTSEQSHSSIEKGAIAIGIGQKNVRKVAVDAEFRMQPDAL